MEAIHKWDLPKEVTTLAMPAGSKVLKAAEQHNRVQLWVQVPLDLTISPVRRVFRLIPTGDTVDLANAEYIDTVFLHEGTIVVHVYELMGATY